MIRHENDSSNLRDGYNFTPLFQGARHWMRISQEERSKLRSRGLGVRGVVTDLDDGKTYKVYGRACDTPGCQCDAEVVPFVKQVKKQGQHRAPAPCLHRRDHLVARS